MTDITDIAEITVVENVQMINLIAGDGGSITVRLEAAKLSAMILKSIKDMDLDDSEELPLVNLIEIKTTAELQKIVDFMNHHCDNKLEEISKPLRYKTYEEEVSEFCYNFIKIPEEEIEAILIDNLSNNGEPIRTRIMVKNSIELQKLIINAEYLEYDYLYELGCSYASFLMNDIQTCLGMQCLFPQFNYEDGSIIVEKTTEPTVDDIEILRKQFPWIDPKEEEKRDEAKRKAKKESEDGKNNVTNTNENSDDEMDTSS